MLAFLVTATSRRRLLELLWGHGASGTISALAKRARVGFASAHRELKAMEELGLVTLRAQGGRAEYAAATDHPEAELLRRLVAVRPRTAAASSKVTERVQRRARALGAPLAVPPLEVADGDREEALVEAVELARRDATLARALPVAIAAQRDRLDRDRLTTAATRARQKHALGFLLALTGELTGDRELGRWAATMRDHRVRRVKPFFMVPSTAASRATAARRSPAVARAWGYALDMDLDSFRAVLQKHRG